MEKNKDIKIFDANYLNIVYDKGLPKDSTAFFIEQQKKGILIISFQESVWVYQISKKENEKDFQILPQNKAPEIGIQKQRLLIEIILSLRD